MRIGTPRRLVLLSAVVAAGAFAMQARVPVLQDAQARAGHAVSNVLAATSSQSRIASATPVANIAPAPGTPLYATVTPDPTVPRPSSTPCVVNLFSDVLLDEATDGRSTFAYAPPSACSGPWAKVVLEADFNYEAEVFSDTTAGGIWLGGVNLYFGGTPSQDVEGQSSWHVERDLTDYNALLRRAGSGHIQLDRAFFGQFVAMPELHASARLLIYPATPAAAAPRKPDAVYALGTFVPGDTTEMSINANHPEFPPSTLGGTFTLPRNIERAYLDVFAIGVDQDLVWWSCIPSHWYQDQPVLFRGYPNGGSAEIGKCLRGSFREVEVSIDGVPAGTAPVVPWVPVQAFANDFPFQDMHRPTPTPRALNVLPYRVDLSPFAGVLSNGAPHTVAVTIASGDATGGLDFEAAATLLVFRDPHSTTVSGAITRNTLAGTVALPTVTETLGAGDGLFFREARVVTTLRRSFVIEGYVDTARGRLRNRVVQTNQFTNTQDLAVTSLDVLYSYAQDQHLVNKVWRDSYHTLGATQLRHDYAYFSAPLSVSVSDWFRRGEFQNNIVDLAYHQGIHQQNTYDRSNVAQFRTRHDQAFDGAVATSEVTGDFNPHTFSSTASFTYSDNRGGCFGDAVTTNEGVRTGYASGIGCPGGVDFVRWFTKPDGAPDSLGWAGYQ